MNALETADRPATSGYLALGELIIHMTHVSDRNELLKVVAQTIPRILAVDRASVALLVPSEAEAEVFALEGEIGDIPVGRRFPLGNSMIGSVVSSGETKMWDLSIPSDRVDAVALVKDDGMRWIVNAPVLGPEGIVGTINIASKSAAGYMEEDIALLDQVASLLSATLRRQHLQKSTEEAVERTGAYSRKLEAVNAIAQQLARALKKNDIFSTVSKTANGVVANDRVSVAVRESGGSAIRLATVSGEDRVLGEGTILSSDSSVGRAFRTGEIGYWPELQPETYPDHAALTSAGLNSAVTMPIWGTDGPIATLNIASYRTGLMSPADQTTLTMLVNLMSVTLSRLNTLETLERQAHIDAATGLPNRQALDRALSDLVASMRSTGRPAALCFIDIDHFKTVNDSYGYQAGDALLKGVIDQIVGLLHKDDLLARVGGDEFTLLLPGRTVDDAMKIAERTRRAVAEHSSYVEGQLLNATVSIGVAEIRPNSSVNDVILDADTASCLSKDAGRNRVTAAPMEKELLESKRSEAHRVNHVKRALANRDFRAFAQPIWQLQPMEIVAYELLARMADENGRLLTPASFVSIAERFDLITGIDTWMFEQAVNWVSGGAGQNVKQACFVNLSARSLESEEFLEHVLAVVSTSGVSADRIGFEITERVAVTQVTKAAHFIETLSDLGCQFALDDFGSGFSSFGALKSLPVHYIKVDGLLVRDVEHDVIGEAAVRAIAQFANALNARTIAEFVENPDTVAKLRELGITHAQGYGIGGPVPLEMLSHTNPSTWWPSDIV